MIFKIMRVYVDNTKDETLQFGSQANEKKLVKGNEKEQPLRECANQRSTYGPGGQ